MTDRPEVLTPLDRATGSARTAVLRRPPASDGSRRALWLIALAALVATIITVLMPASLAAQGAVVGGQSSAKGKVVVEHSTGDLDLSTPATPPSRAARLVRVGGMVSDTTLMPPPKSAVVFPACQCVPRAERVIGTPVAP